MSNTFKTTPDALDAFTRAATRRQSVSLAPRRHMGRGEQDFYSRFMPSTLVAKIRQSITREASCRPA